MSPALSGTPSTPASATTKARGMTLSYSSGFSEWSRRWPWLASLVRSGSTDSSPRSPRRSPPSSASSIESRTGSTEQTMPLHSEMRDSMQLQGAHGVAMIHETGKTVPWLVVCAIISGLAVALGITAVILAVLSEREARMLEYYVMENDHKLVQHGLLNPDDTWSAKKSKRDHKR